MRGRALWLVVVALAVTSSGPPPAAAGEAAPAADPGIVDALLRSLAPDLGGVVAEVLERNPEVAEGRARARALEQRAAGDGSLPDPMAMVNAFVLAPQTRVGSQRLMAAVAQSFPWFGKLRLRQQAMLWEAAAARAEVESTRLGLVTRARRLVHEMAFVEADAAVLEAERETLAHYEELGLARYASGQGLQQEVIRIQAEITRLDARSLGLEDQRSTLLAELNGLRDRPAAAPAGPFALPPPRAPELDGARLRATALVRRPELAAADAGLARAAALSELAGKERRPDFTLGVTYGLVERRDDPEGRANPPTGNGEDDFGLTASFNLPVRRQRLDAVVGEAAEMETAAQRSRDRAVVAIETAVGSLLPRIDLTGRQLRLFDDVLRAQAEESLRSAEAAYAAGALGALELLDAERVLLEVRTGIARNEADLAIALAELEGAVAAPLSAIAPQGDLP